MSFALNESAQLVQNPHKWNNAYLPDSLKRKMLIALNQSDWEYIKNLILNHPRLLTEPLDRFGFSAFYFFSKEQEKQEGKKRVFLKTNVIELLNEHPHLKQLIPPETLELLFPSPAISSSSAQLALIADPVALPTPQRQTSYLSPTAWWLLKCGAMAVTAVSVFYYIYNNSASFFPDVVSAMSGAKIAEYAAQFTQASLEAAATYKVIQLANLGASRADEAHRLFINEDFAGAEKKREEALQYIENALALDPQNVDLHISQLIALSNMRKDQAALLVKKQDFLGAEKMLNEALLFAEKELALAPQNVDMYNKNKANIFARLGFYLGDEAEILFKKNDFTGAVKKAKEALQYLQEALALAPQNVDILKNKVTQLSNLAAFLLEEGKSLVKKGFLLSKKEDFLGAEEKFKEARQYYEKALVLDPQNINARKGKASAFFNIASIRNNEGAFFLGDKDFSRAERKLQEALQYCEEAIALNPKEAVLRNMKPHILQNLNRAREEIKKTIPTLRPR